MICTRERPSIGLFPVGYFQNKNFDLLIFYAVNHSVISDPNSEIILCFNLPHVEVFELFMARRFRVFRKFFDFLKNTILHFGWKALQLLDSGVGDDNFIRHGYGVFPASLPQKDELARFVFLSRPECR